MKHSTQRPSGSRGSALLIVLAFLLLLTTLTVAFLSRATLERQLSNASFSQGKIDFAAQGAVASIISDLQQEIVAGSNVGAGTTLPTVATGYYYPNSPATAIPYVVGFTPAAGVEDLLKISKNGSAFYSGTSYNTTTYPAPNRASSVNTVNNASLNNRSISYARWNAPLLMAKATPASATDFTPVPAFTSNPPDWIYVARDGSNPTTAYSSAYAITGANATTQRYAYAIYDEGSTLDLNVAGSPSYSTSALTYYNIQPYKPALAYADLTQLPGITSLSTANQISFVNAIVGWRTGASAVSNGGLAVFPGTTTPYSFSTTGTIRPFDLNVLTNMNGFLGGIPVAALQKSANYGAAAVPAVNQTDNAFTSRQQLLQFFLQGLGQNSQFTALVPLTTLQNLLPYVGTFSRGINQPSYAPPLLYNSTTNPKGRPAVLPIAQGGNNANGLDDQINPSFLNATVQTAFTRNDGTPAVAGEPLVKKRFPLNRLSWITYKGPSAVVYAANANDPIIVALIAQGIPASYLQQGTAANIKAAFGLQWITDPRTVVAGATGGVDGQTKWVYNVHNGGGSGQGAIMRLARPPSVATADSATYVEDANREPDFFELLKAAICVGSLGKSSATATTGLGDSEMYQSNRDLDVDAQVMQIGANIIQQFQPDGYPKRIVFDDNLGDTGYTVPNALEYRGVDNDPYIYRVRRALFPVHLAIPDVENYYSGVYLFSGQGEYVSTTGMGTGTALYLQPNATYSAPGSGNCPALSDTGVDYCMDIADLWNPHDANSSRGATGLFPTQFRVVGSSAYPGLSPSTFTVRNGGPGVGDMVSSNTFVATTIPFQIYNGVTTDSGNKGYGAHLRTVNTTNSGLYFTIAAGSGLFREPTSLLKQGVPTGSSLSGIDTNASDSPLQNNALLFPDKTVNDDGNLDSFDSGNTSTDGIQVDTTMSTVGPTPKQYNTNKEPLAGGKYLGFYLGAFPLACAVSTTGNSPATNKYAWATTRQITQGPPDMTYAVQCLVNGSWETIDEKLVSGTYGNMFLRWSQDGSSFPHDNINNNGHFGDTTLYFLDPRTPRFGILPDSGSSGTAGGGGISAPPFTVGTTGTPDTTGTASGYLDQSNLVTTTSRPDFEGGYGFRAWPSSLSATSPWFSIAGGWFPNSGTCQPDLWSQNRPDVFSDARYFGSDTTALPTTLVSHYYTDADGVVRRGSGGFVLPSSTHPSTSTSAITAGANVNVTLGLPSNLAGTISGGVETTTAQSQSRPIILHRPFRTVAELGYVFKGTPFKNLDFGMPESGDSALLDVFCINETSDPNGLVAGKINLNTRQASILQAVLAGAYKDELASSPPALTTAEATNVAQALLQRTTGSSSFSGATAGKTLTGFTSAPLANVSELVGKWVSQQNVPATITVGGASVNTYPGTTTTIPINGGLSSTTGPVTPSYDGFSADLNSIFGPSGTNVSAQTQVLQRMRESSIRALSGSGQTRVWNLMIDVITQTGKFPSSASSLANFTVEGERRCWVHVAIDRYTGKVLDEQVEEVKE